VLPRRHRGNCEATHSAWGATIRIGYLSDGGDGDGVADAVSALEAAGCARVVVDSGARRAVASAAYTALIRRMNAGDTLVITGLEHLSPALPNLLDRLAELTALGIEIECLSGEARHIGPGSGELIRDMQAILRRGRPARNGRQAIVGRPRRLAAADIARARQMIESSGRPIEDVARELGVSRATLYRNLRKV